MWLIFIFIGIYYPLRGVVQLFNAVRQHQKNVDDKMKEVGGSERKRAKVLSSISKKDFIDVLRGTGVNSKAAVKTEKSAVSMLSVPPRSFFYYLFLTLPSMIPPCFGRFAIQ